ncbi:hypothetical protein LZ30DRAFT_694455 [Colletotrichum cereale]|nr:hypothetical protein LZ30DRAFT_694455 [Colletotrichum cereale]
MASSEAIKSSNFVWNSAQPSPSSPVVPFRLMNLPAELYQSIISESSLSPLDRKSLRQTCRAFSGIQTSFLFRRVVISQLQRDLQNFAHICDASHLALAVKEIVWNSMPKFSDYRTMGLDSEKLELCKQLASVTWRDDDVLHITNTTTGKTLAPIGPVDYILECFHSTSKLTTFVSKRVCVRRLLVFGAGLKDPSPEAEILCSDLIKHMHYSIDDGLFRHGFRWDTLCSLQIINLPTLDKTLINFVKLHPTLRELHVRGHDLKATTHKYLNITVSHLRFTAESREHGSEGPDLGGDRFE